MALVWTWKSRDGSRVKNCSVPPRFEVEAVDSEPAPAPARPCQVLAGDGAADVQAVVVAVAHVAQRHAVQGEAQAALVEAADGDAGRPLVGAERVGRLEADARQFLDGPQRAGAGGQDFDLGGVDGLDLAALALAQDDHGVDFGGVGRSGVDQGRGGGRFGGQGHVRRGQAQQGAKGPAQHQMSFHTDNPHAGAQGSSAGLGPCGNSGRRQRADSSVSAS